MRANLVEREERQRGIEDLRAHGDVRAPAAVRALAGPQRLERAFSLRPGCVRRRRARARGGRRRRPRRSPPSAARSQASALASAAFQVLALRRGQRPARHGGRQRRSVRRRRSDALRRVELPRAIRFLIGGDHFRGFAERGAGRMAAGDRQPQCAGELDSRERLVVDAALGLVPVPVERTAQPVQRVVHRIANGKSLRRRGDQGAGRVAVVVTRIAVVLRLPARHLAHQERHRARFRSRDAGLSRGSATDRRHTEGRQGDEPHGAGKAR